MSGRTLIRPWWEGGPQGEEILYTLQRRGSSTRVKPKGAGKRGAPRKTPPGSQGKGSKWDKNGCARCGRSSHWARECTATVDVNGEPPREKPPKKTKGKGKGKGSLNELEEQGDQAAGAEGAEEDDEMELFDESEGEMYVLEEEEEEDDECNGIPFNAINMPDP